MRTTTSSRLKQLLSEQNLKQIDVLRKSIPFQKSLGITMSKSALSQYVNGIQSPDQHRIHLLAKTLGVSEAWLMGFEVSKFPHDIVDNSAPDWATTQDKLQLLDFLNGNVGFNIGPRELTDDEERKMREILATLFWDDLADFRARQSKNNK